MISKTTKIVCCIIVLCLATNFTPALAWSVPRPINVPANQIYEPPISDSIIPPSLSSLTIENPEKIDSEDSSSFIQGSVYSISGRVTDNSGYGMSGVTITATDQTHRSDYQPINNGYKFDNTSYSTNWEIFRDTYGAENVEYTILGKTFHRLAADIYYHWHYKCDAILATCTEVGGSGNCDSMSSSSMVILKNWADPSDFLEQNDAENTWDLPESQIVKDFIVRYQDYQSGKLIVDEKSSSASRSLSANLGLIKNGIDNSLSDPYRIGIRDLHTNSDGSKECAGHSLMPYAYWDEGDETHILVYDPNNPESDNQILVINPINNTWVYDHRNSLGTWSNNQDCEYSGTTSLIAIPVAAYQDHPLPPWESSDNLVNTFDVINMFTAGSGGQVLITDDLGRRVGFVDGQLLLEIPGSDRNIPEAAVPGLDVSNPDEYIIPGFSSFEVSLTNSNDSTLAFMGIVPGGIVEVSGEAGNSTSPDIVEIPSDLQQVSLLAGSDTTNRSVTVATDAATIGSEIQVNSFNLSEGESVILSKQVENYEFSFTSTEEINNYGVALEKSGEINKVFYGTIPELSGGDTHYVSLDWQNPEEATVDIDHQSDGDIDESIVIENELTLLFLPIIMTTFGSIASDGKNDFNAQDVERENPHVIQMTEYTAITDVNGYYTITGVKAGLYTLTASKSAITFTPASIILSVPPSATNQNFLANIFNISPTLPPDGEWVLIDDYFPGNWMLRGFGYSGLAGSVSLSVETPKFLNFENNSLNSASGLVSNFTIEDGSFFSSQMDNLSSIPISPTSLMSHNSTFYPSAPVLNYSSSNLKSDVNLILDDGSIENGIGIGGTQEFIWINRFTPPADAYPFTLEEVQVYFDSSGLILAGDEIIIVVYENNTGNTDPAVGSNWLYSYPTTIQALNAWNTYTLPVGIGLNGPGDVLIGLIALEKPGTSYWPAAIDQTATQTRSWIGWWLLPINLD